MSGSLTIDELRDLILLAPVTDMEPHIKKGQLILIDPSLDLAETAFLIATNDHPRINDYIAKSLLSRPSIESYAAWKQEKIFFEFVITQPFVIAKKFTSLNPKN